MWLAGNGDLQWQANAGVAPFTLPVDDIAERLELLSGNVGEGYAMQAATFRGSGILPPNDPGFRLDGPSICLDLNPDRTLRPQALS